ncbi:MAG: ferritin-like domain-containing protein [Ferruginibacter sp.]
MENNKILQLLSQTENVRDAIWLKESLQAAIELEHSTLPPYLCGMWSIKDVNHPVRKLIKSVVYDEMKHMALVCNMMTAIDGHPEIANKQFVPNYPDSLPGGVLPLVNVWLQGLTKPYLKDVFMAIEKPEWDPLAPPLALLAGEEFSSIGGFYIAILDTFKKLVVSGDVIIIPNNRQIISLGINPINSIQDVEDAISIISNEGEGSTLSPYDEEGQLAHYYQFAQIFYGKMLKEENGKWTYSGDAIVFPDTFPMEPIKEGGYLNPSVEVQNLLDNFNKTYTQLLYDLHNAWNSSEGNLQNAYQAMLGLEDPARALMEKPIPGGAGNYGPTFTFVPVTQLSKIKGIRIFPALAIARFGSSEQPMENYELVTNDSSGFRTLKGATTLNVNKGTGEIDSSFVTDTVVFRDAMGFIKPVAPFFEVWALFDNGDNYIPLTASHINQLNLNIKWKTRFGNLKAFRRTGDADDKINVELGPFDDYSLHSLKGSSPNFKNNATIDLGAVQFIKPNESFPEIRFRFTPAKGEVFGPSVDNVIKPGHDIYDVSKGDWSGHVDGSNSAPESTNPGGIYASQVDINGRNNGVSLGYLDDSCDGIIEIELTDSTGTVYSSMARVTAGPPDFAPDLLPPRTVDDELKQILVGTQINTPLEVDEVIDIVRRALETIQLMSTDTMNVRGMPNHDTGRPHLRVYEPIFNPRSRAGYQAVKKIHKDLILSLIGLSYAPNTPERVEAIGVLQAILGRLRKYDEVGDLSNAGRSKMPAMMRNADGLYLALTNRQRNIIAKAIEQFSPNTDSGNTSENNMMILIGTLKYAAGRHQAVNTGSGGETLTDLFDAPARLISYLKSANAKGARSGDQNGKPLIVPGKPEESAFFKFITTQNHPMNGMFSNSVPSLNKTGVEIVRDWILSL